MQQGCRWCSRLKPSHLHSDVTLGISSSFSFYFVSRCGRLLSAPGSDLRPVLLPQHDAHSPLAHQADGPRDGLTNTFPCARALQRPQEAPRAKQTHSRRRLLGHAPVCRRRALGVSPSFREPDRPITVLIFLK